MYVLIMLQDVEKGLDAVLGLQSLHAASRRAYIESPEKFKAIFGARLSPSTTLNSIAGLITVTSSPAGLLYYYIKELHMVLADWCYPSVDSSWYVGVDTHYNPRVLLQDSDFPQGLTGCLTIRYTSVSCCFTVHTVTVTT